MSPEAGIDLELSTWQTGSAHQTARREASGAGPVGPAGLKPGHGTDHPFVGGRG